MKLSSLIAVLFLLTQPGCAGQASPTMTIPETCGDTLDNDGNGLVDCADPVCAATCQPAQGPQPAGSGRAEPAWPTCAAQSGDRSHVPIDIIWTVDSSYSMKEEMGWIQENMNRFVEHLTGIKLDVRVLVLGGQDICVPAPLGGPNCGDSPRYRHIKDYVGSHDGLKKVIDFYPRYKDFIRPRGKKVLIFTTDDDSEVSASWFTEALSGLTPGFPDGFVFHSIVSYGTNLRGCLTGAAPGTVYLELTDQTQGLKIPICETDWTKIFAELSNNVVQMVDLPCAFKVPALPADKKLNSEWVQVSTSSLDGQWQTLPRRQDSSQCDQGGWYFDAAASAVQLCPVTCHDPDLRQVESLFGCLGAVD